MSQASPPPIRILVADDDADILSGTARLLENAGYTVDRAATGQQSLLAFRNHRPDLVLLERDLPDMDGLEVCRRIKHESAQADIFVLIVSASHTQGDELAKGLESGADGYISRPIANRELLARVASCVHIMRLSRTLRFQAEELKKSNKAAAQAQLASLNLIEDAVAARALLEAANQELRREISERERAEESRARLVAAVEQSAETIVITDADGAILYANPAFEKSTGYTREEALGVNPRILKSGRHDPEFYRQIWAVLGRGEVWSGRFINKKKDGTLYEEDASISPVRDPSGKVLNYVAVKRDITREAQLEAQLRQSQKMEAIGQLSGGVAHDFNNILAAMIMQTELTGMVPNLPDEVREGLRHIRAGAERAANLTRQLLLFSRKQVMQPRELDLNEVVTTLAKMLQRIIGEDVSLQLNLHPRALIIRADPGMLDQVLMNLVVNARDAMPGGGRIFIETSERNFSKEEAALVPDTKPGRHVSLCVTDTGSGIAPENLSRIFEPFFTTKEPGKGTGLGLATVFGIVKQHGGALIVESELGRGATFQVFLPATETPGKSPDALPTKPKPRGGTETILLVEDEAAVRLLTRALLERFGYRVLEASDGVEAVQTWEQNQDSIRLLLTDLVMPEGVSGHELAARLQARNPGLRVIFTSGYSADIAGLELSLQEGQNFIQKPSSPEQLLETVRRCMDT
jgi:two-component system, cell cycle sensor histidine kinase and response regulator CckA